MSSASPSSARPRWSSLASKVRLLSRSRLQAAEKPGRQRVQLEWSLGPSIQKGVRVQLTWPGPGCLRPLGTDCAQSFSIVASTVSVLGQCSLGSWMRQVCSAIQTTGQALPNHLVFVLESSRWPLCRLLPALSSVGSASCLAGLLLLRDAGSGTGRGPSYNPDCWVLGPGQEEQGSVSLAPPPAALLAHSQPCDAQAWDRARPRPGLGGGGPFQATRKMGHSPAETTVSWIWKEARLWLRRLKAQFLCDLGEVHSPLQVSLARCPFSQGSSHSC